MKVKIWLILLLLLCMTFMISWEKVNDCDDIIKVGVYEASPYYEIDDKGYVSGYYHDILKLIQKQYHFEYEYVIVSFSDALTKMKDGEIDLVLGVSVTEDRLDDFIYNRETIATEVFSLYANSQEFCALSNIKSAKIGLVKDSTSAQWMLDYFSKVGTTVDPVYAGDWAELECMFEEGMVDIISLNNSSEKKEYYKIYEFSGDQVYIAGNKKNQLLLDRMDDVLLEYKNQRRNPIQELSNNYFGIHNEFTWKEKLTIGVLLTIVIAALVFVIVPKLQRNKIRKKIRYFMRVGRYLLQYQPIYNPRNGIIIGFEGLLRLLDEDNQLIPPIQFISEIEENNMLYEVSLWIIKRVIREYQEIKQYECVRDKEFYISVNVSLNEIENKKFINKVSELLLESNLGPNKICLEIIERIKVNDLKKVSKNLMLLKQAGFKIAMDDFGTEYSNLDMLMNLDTNIIKIDKCFVEGIDQDEMKNEVIHFISRIAEVKQKEIVLEGVEREAEAIAIRNMKKEQIYVQGYYYNKPLSKEDIQCMC